MGLSVNEFIYAGDDEFTLNFAMGYASRSDVTAYKVGDPNVDLSFDWLTDNQVRLASGQVLVNGDTIVFRRTVSKQSLPVDLTQPGEATRENLETMFKHGLYIAHEVLDERADFIPVNELVLPVSKGGTGADNATGAALNLGILAGINILAPENNLSDLDSAVDALVNLGVDATADELNALVGVTTKGTELVRATDEAAARAALGLGTASTATTGTATGNVPVLVDVGGSPGLPAVDGSQLTGLASRDIAGAKVLAASGTPSIVASFGIASVSSPSTGIYTYTFSTPRATADSYIVIPNIDNTASGSDTRGTIETFGANTATSFTIRVRNVNNGAIDRDHSFIVKDLT